MKIFKTLIFFLFIMLLTVPLQPVNAQDRDPQAICGDVYVIQRGDTLRGIAVRCETSVADLLAVNPQITNPSLIFAGQRINIPGEGSVPVTGVSQSPIPVPVTGPGTSMPFYIVKPGDSLNYLANRYDTDPEAFLTANPFLREERLRVGMILDLPARTIDQPAVAISPTSGLPGTELRVVAAGLPADTTVELGLGPLGVGYYRQGTVDTDEDGRIDTRVNIPEWADLDEIWRVVIDRTDTSAIDAASNEFYVVQRGSRIEPVQYLIRPGDTLSWISTMFGVSIDDILEANPQITNPRRIITGQYVLIPGPEEDEGSIPVTGQAQVSVSPPRPVPGTTFYLFATGFPANADVDIWIGRPGASPTIIEEARANQQGVVFINILMPANAPREQWVAYVVTRDRSVSAMSPVFTPEDQAGIPVTGTGDPRDQLGNPAFRDTFMDDRNWLVSDGLYTSNRIDDGSMELVAHTSTDGWRITRQEVENYYLEMTVRTGEECEGGDRYGLFVNLPLDPDAPHTGNQFGVTCNGRYFLRSWHAGSGTWLIQPTQHNAIHSGEDQTNRLGIMVEGAQMTLFINGERIAEASDNTYAGRGRFGIFIGAPETEEFTINIDDIAYWNLQ